MQQGLRSKVLVVNKSADAYETIKHIVDNFQCNVLLIYASDANDAIEALNQEKDISLVMTGIKLDDYTGVTLANHIRKFSKIPIAILTNYNRTSELSVNPSIKFWKRDYLFSHPREFASMIARQSKEPFADKIAKISLS